VKELNEYDVLLEAIREQNPDLAEADIFDIICHVALVSAKPADVRHLCSLLNDRKSLRPSIAQAIYSYPSQP